MVGNSPNSANPGSNFTANPSGSNFGQPNAPGTNSSGTAQSSGSSALGSGSVTTGSAGHRASKRVNGVDAQGPNRPGDAAIRAEDALIDKKIKSICRGC